MVLSPSLHEMASLLLFSKQLGRLLGAQLVQNLPPRGSTNVNGFSESFDHELPAYAHSQKALGHAFVAQVQLSPAYYFCHSLLFFLVKFLPKLFGVRSSGYEMFFLCS